MRQWCAWTAVVLLLVAGPAVRAEETSFLSNGVKIVYTIEGEGEPVILIHGFAANGLVNWRLPGICTELAKSYRVITPDNRGHGKSGKPHETSSYGIEMVEDVVRLMDHLKISKAHVVGYSMGGLIVHKLMVTHPDRLRSATIGGMGWLRDGDPGLPLFVDELANSCAEGKGIAPLISRLTPIGRPQPTAEELRALNLLIMAMNDGKALAAVARGFGGFTVTEQELLANHVPCQVVIGGLDPLKSRVEMMKEKRPDLKVVEIEGTDHMTTFSNPAFTRCLKEFLNRNGEH